MSLVKVIFIFSHLLANHIFSSVSSMVDLFSRMYLTEVLFVHYNFKVLVLNNKQLDGHLKSLRNTLQQSLSSKTDNGCHKICRLLIYLSIY